MNVYTFDSRFNNNWKKNRLVGICGHNRVKFGK